ncbi:MAG: class I SAM-dependent DNA methyltransferase, partial [Rhodospirillales bacterium]|nr:class I SAM-dependent DNA methyltransferase [Rhodospirillales bacterium]
MPLLRPIDDQALDLMAKGEAHSRALDPDHRTRLGAHYTDPVLILKLIEPIIARPLLADWARTRQAMREASSFKVGLKHYEAFHTRLAKFRVLDPACGSGNFLCLALKVLQDIEQRMLDDAAAMALPARPPRVGPHQIMGLEVDETAADFARQTIRMADITRRQAIGLPPPKQEPDYAALVECRDALVGLDGEEAEWPDADVVIGNPPFLGNKSMVRALGAEKVRILREAYRGKVPAAADLVCYWFEKARAMIESGRLLRAGLLATNSIRGGANREVLERINATGRILQAWADEPWVQNGAAVRVSLICFEGRRDDGGPAILDGCPVPAISTHLAAGPDLTRARPLPRNGRIAFQGPVLVGPFDVPGDLARSWLSEPGNARVLKPLRNGLDLMGRCRDRWVIDFGRMDEDEAAGFAQPFAYVREHCQAYRRTNRDAWRCRHWWLHGRTGDGLRAALRGTERYLATSQVAKHRAFVWLPTSMHPHQTVIALASGKDELFGLLHSRFHRLWALRLGTSLEDRPRYTPTTCFETF